MKTVFTKLKYGKAHERQNRPLSQRTKYQAFTPPVQNAGEKPRHNTRLLNCVISNRVSVFLFRNKRPSRLPTGLATRMKTKLKSTLVPKIEIQQGRLHPQKQTKDKQYPYSK
ncbi:hypothetical protein PoB_005023700 [Plakobranchus ocellatus]|uniref:Uncharacterized protein n=1 Tax=Plakobranchus ocellatus TaxID=259542 RepID=A0AAV4BXC2_9GAST|nr:hypothetical protein PoB_005023700 [Plakobranchus ocellatus]